MKLLLDGDLAANNGGWQWAASTGCDAQPYFRVFNPWLQGKKFDPEGAYIKHFVPELRNLPSKALHAPDADRGSLRYPKPMVDHAKARQLAIRLYRKLQS
jgi:deoxyribodipyrimidine photo-lyase